MGWFRRWQMRRAAKQYAGRLGSHLARAYGPSEFYSPGQIRTAVAKLGLNPKFIALGYAAFLPEEDFCAVADALPISISYQHARDLFERFRPPHLFESAIYHESGFGIVGGSDH